MSRAAVSLRLHIVLTFNARCMTVQRTAATVEVSGFKAWQELRVNHDRLWWSPDKSPGCTERWAACLRLFQPMWEKSSSRSPGYTRWQQVSAPPPSPCVHRWWWWSLFIYYHPASHCQLIYVHCMDSSWKNKLKTCSVLTPKCRGVGERGNKMHPTETSLSKIHDLVHMLHSRKCFPFRILLNLVCT